MDELDTTHSTRLSSLVAAAQRGDREARDGLFGRCRPRIQATVRALVGPGLRGRIDVEDVVQETLMKAHANLERFSYRDDESVFRWLNAIARHIVLNATQKRATRPLRLEQAQPIEAEEKSPTRGPRREERFEKLRAALDKLTPDLREAILLVRIEGLSIPEAARRMKRSEAAVRQLISRGLRRLRSTIGGETESLHLLDHHSLARNEDEPSTG